MSTGDSLNALVHQNLYNSDALVHQNLYNSDALVHQNLFEIRIFRDVNSRFLLIVRFYNGLPIGCLDTYLSSDSNSWNFYHIVKTDERGEPITIDGKLSVEVVRSKKYQVFSRGYNSFNSGKRLFESDEQNDFVAKFKSPYIGCSELEYRFRFKTEEFVNNSDKISYYVEPDVPRLYKICYYEDGKNLTKTYSFRENMIDDIRKFTKSGIEFEVVIPKYCDEVYFDFTKYREIKDLTELGWTK